MGTRYNGPMVAVRLLVSDVKRALETYVNCLEFDLIESWGDAFAIIERNGIRVWLSGPSSSAQRPLPDGAEPMPGGWNRLVITVESIPDTLIALKELNLAVRSPGVKGPGGTQALVEDGVGNLVELFQPAENS